MKKPVVLLLNGPNLDMLGRRDPAQYGTFTLADVERAFAAKCEELLPLGEGILDFDAILDALLLAKVPTMEVHISDVDSREPFRRVSVIRPACVGRVAGLGLDSYLVGLERLVREHVRPG